jgi:hypothetical protein
MFRIGRFFLLILVFKGNHSEHLERCRIIGLGLLAQAQNLVDTQFVEFIPAGGRVRLVHRYQWMPSLNGQAEVDPWERAVDGESRWHGRENTGVAVTKDGAVSLEINIGKV